MGKFVHVMINSEDGSILAWNDTDVESADEIARDLKESGAADEVVFLEPDEPVEDKLVKIAGLDAKTPATAKVELTGDAVTKVKEVLEGVTLEDHQVILQVGEYVLDQDACEVRVKGEEVLLSPTEFKLMRYFMLNPNRVLSKKQILDYVWEYDFAGDANIVESYVSYLRKKLDVLSDSATLVTRRGFGYMLKTHD